MMGKSPLTPDELKTVTDSSNSCKMMTANETFETNEGRQSLHQRFGHSCASSCWTTPRWCCQEVVLETMGHSHSWKVREQPSLNKDGIAFRCRSENHVPAVATPAQAGGDSLPVWSQPLTEGLIDEHLPIEAGGDSTKKEEAAPPLFASRPNESKPTSNQTVFTHFPQDPNRETCKMTKNTRARCQNRLDMRKRWSCSSTCFGNVITADPRIPSEGSESRWQRRYAVVFVGFLLLLVPLLSNKAPERW